jgi:serine/threonine protein kinase/WD40 repeat protein
MTDLPTALGPDEMILFRFQNDYEAADDKSKGAVVRDYCDCHPHLATRIRARAALGSLLDRSGSEPAEPLPERFGEFRVVRRIGGGGMGWVYEALHDRLNRRVAVKTIRPDRASPSATDRFRREQRALARLHQTHIVSIFEAGEEGPVHYFAMPYIDGAPLSSVVQTALRNETSVPQSQTPSLAKLAAQLAAVREQAGGGGPVEVAAPPAARGARLALSAEYFRSVAEALADAAEALQHTHDSGLLHRDVKPSNLMVDLHGHCWVIDYGLAGLVHGREGEEAAADPLLAAEPVTATGVVGTPQYMAPEQWKREKGADRLDARTDVYGLGVTLYELLTLRRAFDGEAPEAICAKVLGAKPLRIEELATNVPPDLAAICRKAIQKGQQARYAAAQELADDLHRWLRHEPTRARGAWAGRRMWLWGRRNPGWAAATLLALVAVATVTQMSLYAAESDKNAAEARADAADQAAQNATEKERTANELRLNRLQRIRLMDRTDRWFTRSWGLVGEAAEIRKDANIKNEAAATLRGLDAFREKEFKFDTSWLTFDSEGDRLLIGAAPAVSQHRPTTQGAKIWDLKKADLSGSSKQTEGGPVAFRRDGTPVQLVPGEKLSLQLWDVTGGKTLQEFRFSAPVEKEGMKLAGSAVGFALLAATPDSSRVAAAAVGAKETGAVAVWDGNSGKRLLEVPQQATALALAPSGALFAAANREGDVTVWSLPEGKVLGQFRVIRTQVNALNFSADAASTSVPDGMSQMKGQLAVGGEGGHLGIWHLHDKMTVSLCRGSRWNVFCAAFSPDGTVLASGGREAVHLWDTATGRKLLSLTNQDWVTGLAFSPDGKRLAAGGRSISSGNQCVVWRLEEGRGIQTLRGLSQPVASVRLSRGGKRLAAITHDWEVGVWDFPQGRLRRVFRVPPGMSADNAALALSQDGRQLAYCSGQAARLWKVDSDEAAKEWALPPGLVDRMAFDADGRLLLCRFERDGRAYQVRNLLGTKPLDPIASIRDFVWVIDAVLTPDGGQVAVTGLSGPKGEERWVKVFTTATGKEVWAEKVERCEAAALAIDPEGKILAFQHGLDATSGILAEVATGKHIHRLAPLPYALSPRAKYTATMEENPVNKSGAIALRYGKDHARLLDLGIDVPVSYGRAEFDGDGNRVAWGNVDGTVSVADLKEVQKRLAELRLGWE